MHPIWAGHIQFSACHTMSSCVAVNHLHVCHLGASGTGVTEHDVRKSDLLQELAQTLQCQAIHAAKALYDWLEGNCKCPNLSVNGSDANLQLAAAVLGVPCCSPCPFLPLLLHSSKKSKSKEKKRREKSSPLGIVTGACLKRQPKTAAFKAGPQKGTYKGSALCLLRL